MDFYTFLSLPNILKNFFLVYFETPLLRGCKCTRLFHSHNTFKNYFLNIFSKCFSFQKGGKDKLLNPCESNDLTKVFNILTDALRP